MKALHLIMLSILSTAFTACAQDHPSVTKAIENRATALQVEVRFDQNYAGNNNPKQALDLFLPKDWKAGKPLPVVAFIHGGGWMAGDRRDMGIHLVNVAATRGYAVASIGYRLAPEAHWPEQIYDCKAAIRWLRAHAKELNLDTDRIAAWGHSAGGHLVALLGVTGDVKELEGKVGTNLQESSRVTCVLNVAGPSDLTQTLIVDHEGKPLPGDDPAVVGLIGGTMNDKLEETTLASPINYITADDAPILIIHGTKDERVAYNHATLLHDKLKQTGVSSLLIPMQDAGHSPGGNEVIQRMLKFLSRHLEGAEVEISDAPISLGQ